MGSSTATEAVSYTIIDITDKNGARKGKRCTIFVQSPDVRTIDESSDGAEDGIELLAELIDSDTVIKARRELARSIKVDVLAGFGEIRFAGH